MKHLQIDKWHKSLRKLATPVCHWCDGFGFISGHDCNGDEKLWQIRCTIQEQCDVCGGTGKYAL